MTSRGAERARDLRASDRLELRVRSQAEDVATARHAVRDYLQARAVPAPVADDVQLVTSELVTNAVVHGSSGWIGVEVAVTPPELVLAISNRGPAALIPPVADWHPARGLAATGRGLGIVRQLCDHVEVRGDDQTATVVCRRGWQRGEAP